METYICLFVSAILAVGLSENDTNGNHVLPQADRIDLGDGISQIFEDFEERRLRRRRMSCDVLSYPLPFGYVNHATCASFCFVNGKNFRGHCEFGWCKCK